MIKLHDPLVADDEHRVEDDYDMSCDIPEWRKRQGWVLIEYQYADERQQFAHHYYQRLVPKVSPPPPEEPAAEVVPEQETPRDNGRESRRITGGNGDKPIHKYQSLTQLIPNPEPDWFIEYRRVVFAEKVTLLEENRKLKEQVKMASDGQLALQTYGGQKDLDLVRERVSLTPYGSTLDKTGRSMVAQLCWLMDWNPFFDVYAFPSKGGRICVMPSYQKLLEIVQEKMRINYETRVMTPQERTDWGLADKEIGFVTEITEVDMFLDFVKAGVGQEYSRIKGFGVWKPGDNVPSTWTPQMVAGKRSLRAALYKLSSYKIASKRLEQALMQAGALNVEETEDGFNFDAPAKPEMADDAEFQAALLKAEIAEGNEGRIALNARRHQAEPEITITIEQPAAESSPQQPPTGHGADSMPAITPEPAPAVVEPPAPEASELDEYLGPRTETKDAPEPSAEPETPWAVNETELIIANAPEPDDAKIAHDAEMSAETPAGAICSECGLEAADTASPYPTMCKGCGQAEADRQAKKDEARAKRGK